MPCLSGLGYHPGDMGTLNRVWVATLTQRQPFAGTDSGLSLRMFGMGGNTLVDRKLSRRHPYDEEMAQAGLYEVSGVRVPRVNLASAEVGIRGGDMWMPRFVFVWGDVNGREPEPIGIFPRGPIPLGSGISTDRSEGPPSLPLAIVPPGDANTGIDSSHSSGPDFDRYLFGDGRPDRVDPEDCASSCRAAPNRRYDPG